MQWEMEIRLFINNKILKKLRFSDKIYIIPMVYSLGFNIEK